MELLIEMLRVLRDISSPILDTIFGFITMLGEETIAIVLLCLIYWCINKRMAYVIGIAYFFSGLAVQGMKISFRIDRPWVIDSTLNTLESAKLGAGGYSFPSGHTQSATALFGSLALKIKQAPLKAVCILVVLLVAFSRMYLGVHTLLDVGVSLVITTLIVLIVAKLLAGDEINKKRDLIVALVLVVFAVAVIAIAAVMYFGGTIEASYMTDCLKAAGAGIGFAVGMYIERAYINFSVHTKRILWQIIKFVIGIAGVLVIKEGLKLVFAGFIADSVAAGFIFDTVRYFLICTWVTVFFPLIIKRFFAKEKNGVKDGAKLVEESV